jgi:hypothetical protein
MMPLRRPSILTTILLFAHVLTAASALAAPYRFITPLRSRPLFYVRNLDDLALHFQWHRTRVVLLGMALYDTHSEVFGMLPRHVVDAFLRRHDNAKMRSDPSFRTLYWSSETDGPTFLERLWASYGVNKADLTADEYKQMRTDIALLNGVDRAVAVRFLRTQGFLGSDDKPNAQGRLLLRLERLADVADRNTDPVAREEFAETEQLPLANFLTDEDDHRMVMGIKTRYNHIVRGAAYADHCRHDLGAAGTWDTAP